MLFIIIVLSIPIYGLLIWTFIEPEESLMFGNRWRYNGTPKFSELQILLTKIGAIMGIIFMSLLIIIEIFA